MGTITRIDTVQHYCDLFGIEALHPLISVVNCYDMQPIRPSRRRRLPITVIPSACTRWFTSNTRTEDMILKTGGGTSRQFVKKSPSMIARLHIQAQIRCGEDAQTIPSGVHGGK